jgi:hypothetical protein
MTVWIDGTRHTIPDRWLQGFQLANPGASIRDAIEWWEWQHELEAEWETEHGVHHDMGGIDQCD